MSDPISTNRALTAAKRALDGLTRRQEVISSNLANVDTPGYTAKQLNFESALRSELSRSGSLDLQSTQAGHLSPAEQGGRLMQVINRPGGTPRADGNTVDIDRELLEMSETSLRFETLTTLLNKRYSLLREIANRR
jgi:flagellar basal-body rod protein FlgB